MVKQQFQRVGLNVCFYGVLKGLCPLEAFVVILPLAGSDITEKPRWKEKLGCIVQMLFCFSDIVNLPLIKKTAVNWNITCFSNYILFA